MDESFDNTGDAWQSAAEAKMSIEARIESNQRALEVNPNDMGAMMGLAHAYILSENWESAIEQLDTVVEEDPKNAQAAPLLARCFLKVGEMDKADEMFQKALTHIDNVGDPGVWMQVGKMYDIVKNNKAAEDAYKQVLQLEPKPDMKAEALFSLSYVNRLNKRLDLAVQNLHSILEMGEELWPSINFPLTQQDVWFAIGAVLRDDGKVGEERDAFAQSELEPTEPNSWHDHGKLLTRIDQNRQAQTAFLHAIELAEKSNPVLRGEIWFSLARLQGKTFAFKEGWFSFQQFSQLSHAMVDAQAGDIISLRQSLQETGTRNLGLNTELSALKERQAEALDQSAKLNAEKKKFDAMMARKEANLSKQASEVDAVQQKLTICVKQMRMLKIDVDRETARADKRTTQLQERDKQLVACKDELKTSERFRGELSQSVKDKSNKIEKLQAEIGRLMGDFKPNELIRERDEAVKKQFDLDTKLRETTEALSALRVQDQELQDLMTETESREKHKDMLLGKASAKIEKLTGTVRTLQTKSYEQLMAEKAELADRAERAMEQARKSREALQDIGTHKKQAETQSEMVQETLAQEVRKLKKLRASQYLELKNLKVANHELADELELYKKAAERLQDQHGEVTERHDALELERTVLDNKLRKTVDKLEKLERNELVSERRAQICVSIDHLLERMTKVVGSAYDEEKAAQQALVDAKAAEGLNSMEKNASWKVHDMTDSDRALFKAVMTDDVEALESLIKNFGMEEINAINARGKSLLAVAREKEKEGAAIWLEDAGAKVIDPESVYVIPDSMEMSTQWADEDAISAETLADRVMQEIWDATRLIDLLVDMENRFAPLAGQAEYIIGALRDTEADLRVRLAEAIQNENKSKATLAAVKRIAKDDKLVLTDEVKKIKRKTDAQIEKKQFLEWELRAQIDTVAKQGTVSLATQRAVMVDDAKTKMTELVLDKLMEDPSRNPTLAGDLSTRKLKASQGKRAMRRRGSAGSGMAAAMGLSGGGMDASSSGLMLPPPGASASMMSGMSGGPSMSAYGNLVGMDPATATATPLGHSMAGASANYAGSRGRGGGALSRSYPIGEAEANVGSLIEGLETMKRNQEMMQSGYGRPVSRNDVDMPGHDVTQGQGYTSYERPASEASMLPPVS